MPCSPHTPGGTAKSQDNLAPIRAIYSAFAAGDVPGVLGRMRAGIVWNEAESFLYADGT